MLFVVIWLVAVTKESHFLKNSGSNISSSDRFSKRNINYLNVQQVSKFSHLFFCKLNSKFCACRLRSSLHKIQFRLIENWLKKSRYYPIYYFENDFRCIVEWQIDSSASESIAKVRRLFAAIRKWLTAN